MRQHEYLLESRHQLSDGTALSREAAVRDKDDAVMCAARSRPEAVQCLEVPDVEVTRMRSSAVASSRTSASGSECKSVRSAIPFASIVRARRPSAIRGLIISSSRSARFTTTSVAECARTPPDSRSRPGRPHASPEPREPTPTHPGRRPTPHLSVWEKTAWGSTRGLRVGGCLA